MDYSLLLLLEHEILVLRSKHLKLKPQSSMHNRSETPNGGDNGAISADYEVVQLEIIKQQNHSVS